MREAPVLVLHCEGGPVRVTGRWSDGAATFDGFVIHQSFDRVEVEADGQRVAVTLNATTVDPNTTVTILASAYVSA